MSLFRKVVGAICLGVCLDNMQRDNEQSDLTTSSGAFASSIAFQPAPLAQRPGTLATSVLNPALSEDLVSRPTRPPLPSLLKDGALRTISKEITETDKEIDVGIEEGARLVLDEIMNAFLTDVVHEACKLAKRRRTNVVHGRDLGIVMNKR